MDYQEIRYGPAGGAGPQVVQVTLDRPAALNAYTSRMCEELNDALLRYPACRSRPPRHGQLVRLPSRRCGRRMRRACRPLRRICSAGRTGRRG